MYEQRLVLTGTSSFTSSSSPPPRPFSPVVSGSRLSGDEPTQVLQVLA